LVKACFWDLFPECGDVFFLLKGPPPPPLSAPPHFFLLTFVPLSLLLKATHSVKLLPSLWSSSASCSDTTSLRTRIGEDLPFLSEDLTSLWWRHLSGYSYGSSGARLVSSPAEVTPNVFCPRLQTAREGFYSYFVPPINVSGFSFFQFFRS